MLGILRDPDAAPEEKRWAAQHAAPYCHVRLGGAAAPDDQATRHEEALKALE